LSATAISAKQGKRVIIADLDGNYQPETPIYFTFDYLFSRGFSIRDEIFQTSLII
jgi:hypothetical protein